LFGHGFDALAGNLRGNHRCGFAFTEYAIGLLELQIGKTPHCFRCPCAFRRFLEVTAITLCGALKTVVQINIVEIGLNLAKLRQRSRFDGG